MLRGLYPFGTPRVSSCELDSLYLLGIENVKTSKNYNKIVLRLLNWLSLSFDKNSVEKIWLEQT